jgi:drug/metabolite transporter (DMT)-like permease
MRRGYLLVALAASMWGLWPLFTRTSGLPGPQLATLALVGMSLPALWAWRGAGAAGPQAWRGLVALGVFDAGNAALYFSALARGPIAVGVLTHYLAPVLVALLSPWLMREVPSRRAVVSSAVSLFGLALLLGGFPAGADVWPTALLGSGSALFYAGNVMASKRAASGFSPLQVAALHAPISAVLLLLFAGARAVPHGDPTSLAWGVGGGVVCGLVGTTVFVAGLRRLPTAGAGALTYLEPLVATMIAWAVYAEPLSGVGILGALLIVGAGVWVVLEAPR